MTDQRAWPYAGLRVLDLAGVQAPSCGMLLSLYGADVCLVEDPSAAARRNDPQWLAFNMGKRSVQLDLADPEDVERFRTLIEQADVLIDTGEDPGGLDPAAINPGLIRCSITPFGLDGPRASWQATELISQAAGGLLHGCGDVAFPPAIAAIPVAACMAGAQAAVAIELGLIERERAGHGHRIDISVQHSTQSLLLGTIVDAWVQDEPRARSVPPNVPATPVTAARYHTTKDGGYVSWSLSTGPGFGKLTNPVVRWMNEEGVGLELADVEWEKISRYELTPEQLAEWMAPFVSFFRSHTQAELAEGAIERRFMLHPLASMDDVAADELLRERNALTSLTLPDGREVEILGRPFRSTAYDVRLGDRVPALGADTDAVIESWGTPRTAPAVAQRAELPAERRGFGKGPRPLSGLRVLDFSWIVAGPVTAKWLALFGADVAKIESRKRPDPYRMTGPWPLGKTFLDGAGGFPSANANKRSVAIDISHPRARDLILRLGAEADIVVENFSAGVMVRHHLGYEDFKAINPGIIMIALSLQGQTGRRADQPGIGSHVQMRSGLDAISGFPDAIPGGPSFYLPDLMGPWVGLSGILAALEERRQTGIGQYMDLSQYEAMLMWMQPALLERQLTGQSPQRRGNASDSAAPHGTLPVAGDDQWIAIACERDEQWAHLWDLLPADLQARFARDLPLTARIESRDAIEDALAGWTAGQDGVALMEQLQEAGVPAYTVSDPHLVYHDPQLLHRKHFVMADHAHLTKVPIETAAIRTDAWDYPEVVAGPLYASGTHDVLHEWLDISDDEFADLVTDSVITFE